MESMYEKPVAIIDGVAFYYTTKSRDSAERVAKAFGLVVRDYGVNLRCVDPETIVATKWEKQEGYSVWGR